MTDSTNIFRSGVSREEAENIINKFLNNEHYRVLAVKGKWGVGKTHLVQKLLNEHSGEYYYYASVFGISSIEQLKGRIIANSHQSNSNRVNKLINNTVEWLSINAAKLEKTPKLELGSMQIVGSLMSAVGDLGLNILFNENARNSIICIDDLERKSKLPIDELLGFVEYLVQELKCKIILIYSDDNLDQASKKTLKIYREKVIDREFTLAPTVEENLDFIFEDHPDIEVIKSVFIKTLTNNIRVFRKTRWLIDELSPLIADWQPSLRNQVIRNCIVINLVTIDTDFCKNSSITIDNILSLTDSSKYQNNDGFEEQIQLVHKLSYIGYNSLEIDEIIINSVERSLSSYDETEFIKRGEILNEREEKNQVIEKLRNLGKPYHNSFGNSEQEIIEEIKTFLEENHLYLSISEFEQVEQLASIVELDISQYEEALLEHKLKNSDPHYFNDLNVFRAKLRKHPELAVYLEEQKNQYLQSLDISTAIKNIINSNSLSISPWEKENVTFINNCTVEEYIQWLEKGDSDLYLMVKQFLKFGLPASQKLEQAIRILAKKSKLNKIRAKFLYNIDIDNLPNTNDEN
ncbi:hypothetical protein H6G74_07645 [Nostoc spongiaeforme FACHB-130]|uniref:KAP NTPase domain-containing protein n=1 Tax=Nostoc spongiaeforme FACHB-130 TaxID=1357510 RepID=A0ABR8FS21_9NOSO|nr:P-loop NTPase fold protein [Nostoc spongiaeforme]MBD2594202.1 hypothetical protein [Nostoc spongiaeforme FACHB-130]